MIHTFHLPLIPALVIAIVSMALKDFLGTMMVVAQARGAEKLAGHMDGLGDGAQLACQVVGAGTVILTGINVHALLVIIAIMITSDIGTRYWTRYAKRIPQPPDQRILALTAEITKIKAELAELKSKTGD